MQGEPDLLGIDIDPFRVKTAGYVGEPLGQPLRSRAARTVVGGVDGPYHPPGATVAGEKDLVALGLPRLPLHPLPAGRMMPRPLPLPDTSVRAWTARDGQEYLLAANLAFMGRLHRYLFAN